MNKLAGVHPDLVDKITKVLAAMAALGFPMKVTQGVRTVAEQQKLYAQGRTKPGKIVTNADGVVNKSNHQIKSDGWGHALDLCFVHPKPFDDKHPWTTYGWCCKALGLVWGGDFKSLNGGDRPHVELK